MLPSPGLGVAMMSLKNAIYEESYVNFASRLGPRIFTLKHVWHMLPLLLSLSKIWGFISITPHDFWWHIRVGQLILETKQIPRVDLFTFTHRGEPWTYQAWLMELWLYLIYQLGGAPLIVFVHGIMIASAYVILQMELFRLTRNARVASMVIVAIAVCSMPNWAIRPQSISFPLFSLTLLMLLRYQRQKGRSLWWLPLIFLIWANAHGGFVFGLVLLGCFTVGELWNAYRNARTLPSWKVIIPILLAVSAIAINPAGPLGIVRYVLKFVRHPATRSLNLEFTASSLAFAPGALIIIGIGALVVILIYRGYRPNVFESLTLFVFGFLAMWAIRNAPWFGFVAAPVTAKALKPTSPVPHVSKSHYTLNTLILAFLIGVSIISLPWLRALIPIPRRDPSLIAKYTPLEAAEYVCDRIPANARLFNEISFGSYLIWKCPQIPVFMDTRFELYSMEDWKDYLAISAGRYDWQRLLDKRQVTHLLLSRETQTDLIAAVSESPCWISIYSDEVSVVFRQVKDCQCSKRS
ncbi:MAG: hypothetical protein QXZ09_05075 [Candidatus Methanomethylicaceae archaeon]